MRFATSSFAWLRDSGFPHWSLKGCDSNVQQLDFAFDNVISDFFQVGTSNDSLINTFDLNSAALCMQKVLKSVRKMLTQLAVTPPNGIQNFRPSLFTTCTKLHVNPTMFSNLNSNDLQNFCHSMFNTCTKHYLNPTTFSNLTFKWPSQFWPLNVYYMYQASCKSNPIQHVV